MRLARIGPAGEERPAAYHDGDWYDISSLVPDIEGSTLSRAIDAARQLDSGSAGAPRIEAPIRFGPCLSRTNKIVCVGLNYRDHAAESGLDVPEEPLVFMKATNSLSGPSDDVLIPPGSEKLDWELELAVIIGGQARYLPDPDSAQDVVAGYAITNDVTERAAQMERGGQWVKGKSFETFNPLGPWLVTPDQADLGSGLTMRLSVNGEQRQDSTTAEMVFDAAYIVWYLSQFMVLDPGDVVNTGTPAGVGIGMSPPRYLRIGDQVEGTIENLGTQYWKVAASS